MVKASQLPIWALQPPCYPSPPWRWAILWTFLPPTILCVQGCLSRSRKPGVEGIVVCRAQNRLAAMTSSLVGVPTQLRCDPNADDVKPSSLGHDTLATPGDDALAVPRDAAPATSDSIDPASPGDDALAIPAMIILRLQLRILRRFQAVMLRRSQMR